MQNNPYKFNIIHHTYDLTVQYNLYAQYALNIRAGLAANFCGLTTTSVTKANAQL